MHLVVPLATPTAETNVTPVTLDTSFITTSVYSNVHLTTMLLTITSVASVKLHALNVHPMLNTAPVVLHKASLAFSSKTNV